MPWGPVCVELTVVSAPGATALRCPVGTLLGPYLLLYVTIVSATHARPSLDV